MAKQKTAAVYARFSSDLSKDRSITDQIALCETYAKREGLKVTKRFSDRAKTGASMFDRDGLMDLRNAAKLREFDAIIVENLDRLSRDSEDLAGLFKRLNHYGVELLTVNEGKTTAIHVGVRGIIGSMFLADLAHKIKRGQSGRIREGKIPGKLSYGYDLVVGQPGERVINETEAQVIRRIFAEYATGLSPREIATGLTDDHIPAPNGGKVWRHQAFVDGNHGKGLIGNRIYIGEMTWNTHHYVRDPDTGSRLSRPNDASKHEMIEVPHLRIVSQKLWDAAQAVRERRSVAKFGLGRKAVQRGPTRNRDSILSDLLVCGICHGHMRIVAQSVNGNSRVACAAAYTQRTCGHAKSYDVGDLEKLVLDGFRKNLIDPEPIKEAVKAYHETYKEHEKKHSVERLAAERQVNKLTLQIDRLVTAISDSTDPLPALLVSLRAKEAERVGLQERVRLLGASNVVALHPNIIEDYKANVTKLHRALSSNHVTPEHVAAFRNLIDSIVVHQTAKRAPYEVNVYGRLAAIMGVDLFPTMRSAEEIVAAEGLPAIAPSTTSQARSGRKSISPGVISFGRWRAAA